MLDGHKALSYTDVALDLIDIVGHSHLTEHNNVMPLSYLSVNAIVTMQALVLLSGDCFASLAMTA